MDHSRVRIGRAVGALVLTVALAVVGSAAPPGAHPFLVRTLPAQGDRLADPPRLLVLQFSEAWMAPPRWWRSHGPEKGARSAW